MMRLFWFTNYITIPTKGEAIDSDLAEFRNNYAARYT